MVTADRPADLRGARRRSSTSAEAERQDDFISLFLDSEVDGHRLTHDDVLDIGYLFFLAGLDTVTASLDCMLAYLAQHPEQRQQLVDDPSLIPARRRGDAAVGDAGAGRRPHHHRRTPSSAAARSAPRSSVSR